MGVFRARGEAVFFKTNDNIYAQPATITKRALARLIDYLLISIIPAILFMVNAGQNNGANALYDDPTMYSGLFVGGAILYICSYLAFLVAIPMFNDGKSIGKMALRITPLFMNRQNKYFGLIIRELFFGILLALAYIFLLIAGGNWMDFYNNLIYSDIFTTRYDEAFPGYVTSKIDWYSFETYIGQLFGGTGELSYGGTKVENDSTLYSTPLIGSYEYHYWQYQMYRAYQITISVSFVVILFIWLTMLFSKDKRGFHDILAQTTIVEDNSIMNENRYQQMYEPENLIEVPVKAHDDLSEYLKEDSKKNKKNSNYDPLLNTNSESVRTDYVGNTANWFKEKKSKIINRFTKKIKSNDDKNNKESQKQNNEKKIDKDSKRSKEIDSLNNEKNNKEKNEE